MELKFLASRDAQRSVTDGLGQTIASAVLLGGQPAADDPHADHELIGLVLVLLLQLGAAIAIVLLVGAVELEDPGSVLTEAWLTVVDLVGQIRFEVLTGQFDSFEFAGLGGAGCVGIHLRL